MPDYELAKTAEDQMGVWHGRTADGESVMAMTVVIRDGQQNVLGSVRYIVSLELVNRQLLIFSVLMLLFGLAIVHVFCQYDRLAGGRDRPGGAADCAGRLRFPHREKVR